MYENKLVPWSYSFFCDILLLAVILWKKKKKPLGKYLLSFCRKNTREMNVEVLPVSLSLLLTLNSYLAITLRERCPSMEFFLVRIFSHSDRLRRFTVFSPNTGKYRSEKTPYLDTFQAVLVVSFIDNKKKKNMLCLVKNHGAQDVNWTFRRRPAGLRNVFCTFRLRTVSRGNSHTK